MSLLADSIRARIRRDARTIVETTDPLLRALAATNLEAMALQLVAVLARSEAMLEAEARVVAGEVRP